MSFQELAGELSTILRRGVDEPLPDRLFNDLALRVFRFQCRSNSAYGGFVRRRGLEPERIKRWEDVPFLPSRAFKSATLVSGDPADVERIFRTSGTTRGQGGRGEHHVLDLAIYRASLLPNFIAHLLFHAGETPQILCLLPPPDVVEDSSLSFMMGEVVKAVGGEGSGFFVDEDGEIEWDGFRGALDAAEREGTPVIVAGTAFAFVGWMQLAEENGWWFAMPDGSRILETGGYKGRSMALARPDFYEAVEKAFGIPEGRIVNEYGMTELLSQFYEPVLVESSSVNETGKGASVRGLGERYHRGPPWVRTRALDPLTLEKLPAGEIGVLAHLDLGNLGSVAGVLTEDLGREVPGGFQLLGRNPGSEPRGCSLAMEDFLASQVGET